jgi:hypothetical protein
MILRARYNARRRKCVSVDRHTLTASEFANVIEANSGLSRFVFMSKSIVEVPSPRAFVLQCRGGVTRSLHYRDCPMESP